MLQPLLDRQSHVNKRASAAKKTNLLRINVPVIDPAQLTEGKEEVTEKLMELYEWFGLVSCRGTEYVMVYVCFFSFFPLLTDLAFTVCPLRNQ